MCCPFFSVIYTIRTFCGILQSSDKQYLQFESYINKSLSTGSHLIRYSRECNALFVKLNVIYQTGLVCQQCKVILFVKLQFCVFIKMPESTSSTRYMVCHNARNGT